MSVQMFTNTNQLAVFSTMALALLPQFTAAAAHQLASLSEKIGKAVHSALSKNGSDQLLCLSYASMNRDLQDIQSDLYQSGTKSKFSPLNNTEIVVNAPKFDGVHVTPGSITMNGVQLKSSLNPQNAADLSLCDSLTPNQMSKELQKTIHTIFLAHKAILRHLPKEERNYRVEVRKRGGEGWASEWEVSRKREFGTRHPVYGAAFRLLP